MLILQDVTDREKAERERKRAEENLRVHASLLHVFHKITSAPDLRFEEKLIRLLQLSCEQFKLPIGMLSRVDGEYHEVLVSIPGEGAFAPGRRYRPPDIYWGTSEEITDQIGSEAASATHSADAESRLGTYIGVQVMVDSAIFGALCFRSIEPRRTPFSSTDREALKLMAQWVGSELQRTGSEAHMRRLSSALEQTAETVMIADKNRFIEYVNPAFEQLTGYAKKEAIGQKSSFLRHDILESSFYEKLWQTISGGQVFRGVLANRKKDGAIYFEEKTITPMRDPEGNITHYISTGHDVTEKKNAEEAARRHQAELAHVARLSTLGEMTSGLAHELNQPLCAITTYAQTCLRLLSAENFCESEVRYGLEQVVKQAELGGAIFRRLRNFARKGEFVRQRVSMRNIVSEVTDLIKSELAHSEIILKVEGVRGATYVEVDPIQIEQVILNLVRNSMDAMAGNGAIDKHLTIRTAKIGKTEVKVSISDTGHGCRPEVVERLFEPFFSTKPTGLGIGLGLSQTIIEAHGGKLWLESTSDAGATFSFVLPSQTGNRHVNSEDKAAHGLHRR
jgi:PAS domain S-box-containing protein